jgi:alpha-beta hydrolase superfamily lysophospholipase
MSRLPVFLFAATMGCAARHPQCFDAVGPLGAPAGYRVRSADGLCLQGYAWAPAGPPRGAVVVVHGIRHHATRYGALAEALAADGLLVVAQDHRGHGRSGGKRQRFDAIADLEGDVDLAVARARAEAPGVPLFLYGHSLGGLVATTWALDHRDALAGLVLSGPALRLPPDLSPGTVRAAKAVAAIAPGLRAQPVDDTVFVRDPAEKQALASDPLVDHFDLPAASAAAAVRGIERVESAMEQVTAPLLAMHGTADLATNVEGSRALVARAASADKTLKLWDGLAHDLLHEPERTEVVAVVTAWIDARLPADGTASEP